ALGGPGAQEAHPAAGAGRGRRSGPPGPVATRDPRRGGGLGRVAPGRRAAPDRAPSGRSDLRCSVAGLAGGTFVSNRPERVAERIKRETAEILENDLNDPRLHGMVSVTDVEVTHDLSTARIFVSTLAEGEARDQ